MKLSVAQAVADQQIVAPRTGAWIETVSLRP